MNVLVVEDDALLAAGLQSALIRADYTVTHVVEGRMALASLDTYDIDLVILDLGLPDMDGLEVLQSLRTRKLSVPVLVLTARDGIDQQVAALDAGADDYMEKPFDLRELQARVRALLRRGRADFSEVLRLGPLALDPFRRELRISNELQDLPAREYEVLEALMLNTPRVVSKTRLAQRMALSGDDIGDNAVEVYVHRLRRRLQDCSVSIRTVRSVGYVIEVA